MTNDELREKFEDWYFDSGIVDTSFGKAYFFEKFKINSIDLYVQDNVQDSWRGYQAAYEELQAENDALRKDAEWISVDDRLPREMIDLVLVGRNKGVEAVLPARLIDGEFVICDGFETVSDRQTFLEPTHWMPLPTPPTIDQAITKDKTC